MYRPPRQAGSDANFDANIRKNALSKSYFGSYQPLDEVMSKASEETDSMLESALSRDKKKKPSVFN